MKKRVMILGAGEFQVPIIKKSHEMGHDVIVVSPKGKYPGLSLCDQVIIEDVANEKAILSHAEKLKIDGITTNQTDIPVRTMAYVSSKLGLNGINYETACLFTDKYLMRKKCDELGLDTIKYRMISSLKSAQDFFYEVGGPIIIKPIDSQGSRGVQLVDEFKYIEESFFYAMKFSRSGSVIIEEFLVGDEFVIEGFVYNKQYSDLVVGDSFYFESVKTFSPNCRQFPSSRNTTLVSDFNKKLIEAFELPFGLTHSEIIVSKDRCHLIETAARGGGVNISSKLTKVCTDFDSDAFMIDLCLGNTPNMAIYNTGLFSSYIAFYLPEGIVKSVDGIDDVKCHSSYIDSSLDDVFVGKECTGFQDKTSRIYILLSATSHFDLNESISYFKEALQVNVLTQQGLKKPIWV